MIWKQPKKFYAFYSTANIQFQQYYIVDNVDDLEWFSIWDFLPKTPHGSVIITSRRPELAGIWTGIEVEEMSDEEAFDLLERSS